MRPGAPLPELEPVWPEAPRLVPDAAFPAYRFLGDLHPHPRRDPRGHSSGLPEPAPGLPAGRWRDDRTYLHGIDLYHHGYLWEAHEQWEACYFAATEPAHRELLHGLIQLAAAIIQSHRGRGAGVQILARAVVRHLRAAAAAVPEGGRLAGLDPRALLADVERHFGPVLDPAPPADAGTAGSPPRLVVEP
jgi:GNAT superfamily N-acetyltransferase